jgi:hypothetical protein
MKPHCLTTLALLVAGLAIAEPALANPPYSGGGGGTPQYGGGGSVPTYGNTKGPSYGQMPKLSPYPGIRNADGQWVPYPPGMARKLGSKKGANGWTYNLMQDRLTGEIFIQIEDSSGQDVRVAGRVAWPGSKKTYPVK